MSRTALLGAVSAALALAPADPARAEPCSAVIAVDHGDTVEDLSYNDKHQQVARDFDRAFDELAAHAKAAGQNVCYLRHYAMFAVPSTGQALAHVRNVGGGNGALQMEWRRDFREVAVSPDAPWVLVQVERDWVRKSAGPFATLRRSHALPDGTLVDDLRTFFSSAELVADWRLWALLISSADAVRPPGAPGAGAVEVVPELKCVAAAPKRIRCRTAKPALTVTLDEAYPDRVPAVAARPVVNALRAASLLWAPTGNDPVVRTTSAAEPLEGPLEDVARAIVLRRTPVASLPYTFQWPGTDVSGEHALVASEGPSWKYRVGDVAMPPGSWPLLVSPPSRAGVKVLLPGMVPIPNVAKATDHLYFVPDAFPEVNVVWKAAQKFGFTCRKVETACPPPGLPGFEEVLAAPDAAAVGCVCLRQSRMPEFPAYQIHDGDHWLVSWNVPGVKARPVPAASCSEHPGGWKCKTKVFVTGAELPICAASVNCE